MVRLSQPSLAILPPRYLIFLVYGDRTLYTVEWMAVLYLTWLGLAGAAFNGLKWLNGWCSFQKYSVAAVNVTGVVQCTQVVQLVIMEPRVVLRTEVVIGCILQLYYFVCFGIALITCRRTQMMMASSIVAFWVLRAGFMLAVVVTKPALILILSLQFVLMCLHLTRVTRGSPCCVTGVHNLIIIIFLIF